MHRVTEPELMTAPDQVQAYAEADFSSSDKDFVYQLAQFVEEIGIVVNSKTLIIDLGCGPGNISQKIASNSLLSSDVDDNEFDILTN